MNDKTYRLPNWDGPHTGPTKGANACALTALYRRYDTLTSDRIREIGLNIGHCDPQRVPMNGYMPVQSLKYRVDASRLVLLIFPNRQDRAVHPVRIYTHGQMTVGERNTLISGIVGSFIEYLVALEGPGHERARLASVK